MLNNGPSAALRGRFRIGSNPGFAVDGVIEATVPAGQMAIGNMPVASRVDLGNGLARVKFQTTPKMSTYLVFFGLGDFERATATSDGTEIGVVTQKGKTDQSAFALESGKAVLHEYNDYFGVPYPLPKLDNVASPGRAESTGAMENWGAIYTFEYWLLLDPSISTQDDRQEVFNTAAHEIAHQWFGNLVTMRWWDDLWLNEGFASWMSQRAQETMHPEWNPALFPVFTRERAMALDAAASTHPVVRHVETVEQAAQAFDAITYEKGEAVIRMLEGWIGPDAWRGGVRRYIKAHAYGNAVSDDLWRSMESAAPDKPVTAIAHDFTLQSGVPLIRVDEASCRNGDTEVRLTQAEFTKDRPHKTPLRWRVPVTAQTLGGASARMLVSGGDVNFSVPGCGTLVVNAGQRGYYRTLYAPAPFGAIRRDAARLDPVDALGVLGDTYALGLAGLQPVTDFLDLATAMPTDADPYLWAAITGKLGELNAYYRGDAARQAAFQRFAIARLSPVFRRIGWEPRADDGASAKILRSLLIGTLSALDDQTVIAEANRRYTAQAGDPNAVPGELRKVILAVVSQHADAPMWDQLRAEAQAETTPLVKDNLYTLLASVGDETLAGRALALALTDEPGATTGAKMIRNVAALHPDLAWDFAMAHRAQVDRLVGGSSLARYYPRLGGNSSSPSMIGKLKAYAATLAPTSRKDADTAIADVEYRVMVRRDRLPAVDAWLSGTDS
ncbi:MAG: M1 family metallopeptidase [Dokdonella sp.]|uniref:M1 family metallopeptidase n=1 Tax=Dokdonella sp. TaxID=2291710 RepID=UPI0025B9D498|nr:M1 family metallopeptidase [Dokdonella sp.]MBX3700575.1 M1 family metallopeptidase [Dokdonella sp.]